MVKVSTAFNKINRILKKKTIAIYRVPIEHIPKEMNDTRGANNQVDCSNTLDSEHGIWLGITKQKAPLLGWSVKHIFVTHMCTPHVL